VPLRPPYAVRPTARRLAALVVAALVFGLPPAAEAAPAAPGSAGMGDPYFPLDGNGGIDVVRYRIHDTYDFGRKRLSGSTRLTVRATQHLSRFNLDFLLPVEKVTVDGVKARFRRPNRHELRIRPRSSIAERERFNVVVRYSGHPAKVAWQGESNWLADRHEVVAMNEPHMAAWWFPANDHPRDKARMDISITAPREKQVVANGRLVGRTVQGDKATTHWRADEAMVPYLAFFAAGSYAVDHGRHHGRPWYVAVSKELPAKQRRACLRMMRRTPKLVDWLSGQLGAYPFSATGGLTTGLEPGFSLENQTRPVYSPGGGRSRTTVVHELAHQWFGDSVSVENWRDIWLNEGPATFMEHKYSETHGGQSVEQWLHGTYQSRPANDGFWDLRIGAPGRNHLFDGEVYHRGAMALQALRQRVGNAEFRTILRTWLSERSGGNGSTDDFQALAEDVSGESLTSFFEAWFFTGAKPENTADNGWPGGQP
jgi:aminopeptidase N